MDSETGAKEGTEKEKEDFKACSRHGRRNACPKIICKCQIGNPDATEHSKDCPIVLNDEVADTNEGKKPGEGSK
jgi:hypothetical protein